MNCVFRDTLDRPALVVKAGGQVIISGSLFVNNTYTSAPNRPPPPPLGGTATIANDTAAADALFLGAGSAIYVQPRGTISSITLSAFVNNGNGWGRAGPGGRLLGAGATAT